MTETPECKSVRFDSAEQEVFLNLWRTYDRLRAFEDQLFSGFDLTPQQYNVLRLLEAESPQSIPTLTLAQRLVSRAPDITRMLDKLEEKQWIERERHAENRRVVQIRITSAGRRLLSRIREPLQECHHQQLGHLSKDELQQLRELLRKARAPHEAQSSPWNQQNPIT